MSDKVRKIALKGNLNEISALLSSDYFQDKKELKKAINFIFTEACRKGNLDVIGFLLKDDKKGYVINARDGEGFKVACACGKIDVVKYLLTDKSLKHNIDISIDNYGGFRWACEYNQLEVIKYLLTSTDLKVHADININEDFGFIKASELGHLGIVEYLLRSKELKKKPDINARDDYAFRFACKNGHKELIKVLLNAAVESGKTINISAKNNQVLKELIKDNNYEMLKFLIVDLNLFKFDTIKNIVRNNDEIIKMFEKRELYKNLNCGLSINTNESKINKV